MSQPRKKEAAAAADEEMRSKRTPSASKRRTKMTKKTHQPVPPPLPESTAAIRRSNSRINNQFDDRFRRLEFELWHKCLATGIAYEGPSPKETVYQTYIRRSRVVT